MAKDMTKDASKTGKKTENGNGDAAEKRPELTKEEMIKCFEAVDKAAAKIELAKEAVEKAETVHSDALRAAYDACGGGPFKISSILRYKEAGLLYISHRGEDFFWKSAPEARPTSL